MIQKKKVKELIKLFEKTPALKAKVFTIDFSNEEALKELRIIEDQERLLAYQIRKNVVKMWYENNMI